MNQGQLLTLFMLHFNELERTHEHSDKCSKCRQGLPCNEGRMILSAFQVRHEELKHLMEDFSSSLTKKQ